MSTNGHLGNGNGVGGNTTGDHGTGPDALTPFEFALAGVSPPGADAISSLRVIEDMRSLADAVPETPVTDAGLNDFLESGGRLSLGRDRRRLRRAATEATVTGAGTRAGTGAFIDITPADMVAPLHEPAAPDEPAAPAVPAALEDQTPVSTTGGVPDAPSVASDEIEVVTPGEEQSIDAIQAELQLALGVDHDEPEAIDPVPMVEHDATDPELHLDLDELDLGELPAAVRSPESMVTGPIAGRIPTETSTDGDPDHPGPDGHEPEETEFVPVLGSTTDGLRDDAGRFGPVDLDPPIEPEQPAEPAWSAAMAGDGPSDDAETQQLAAGPVLLPTADDADPNEIDHRDEAAVVGAAAAPAGLLADSATSPPMVATVPHQTLLPASRRPGGAIMALAGAGAAAAMLIAGSLWWANTSSSRTDTDAEGAEVVAAPTTASGSSVADGSGVDGSLSGPAERSTGDDDEPAEFRGDGPSSAASTVSVTTTARPGDDRTSTTDAGVTTTAVVETTASTAPETSASSTTTASTTTTPTSTTNPPSSTTVTTIRPVTTSTLAPSRPVYIGDRVSVGSYDGPGLGNVQVRLYLDENRDGVGDRQISSTITSNNGRYSFDLDPGCYEVRFIGPPGYEAQAGLDRQAVCLESGESNARIDAIFDLLVAAEPPSGCLVEEPGPGVGLGVEVYETGQNWARSYTFYSRSGRVIARTENLGPYDTDGNDPTDREWFGAENGFDHRSVWSVAADRNGTESDPITCSRL